MAWLYVNEINFYFNQLGPCIITNLSTNESAATQFNLFPNPVIDKLIIETSLTKNLTGSIFSIDGTKVMDFELMNINNQIDLTDISSGIYFLNITNDRIKKSFKFIKQ